MMEKAPLYDTDKYTALDRWQMVHSASHLEILDEVARMDETEDRTFDGASSMANWLVNRYQMSHRTASEWVRVANAIQPLPAIRAAYQAGRMSWDQVRAATRLATPDTDDEIAEMAPDTTAVVHIPLAALTDDETGSESEEGIPLLAETARRLVCDARLQVNVEDETGTVVGVGRTTRTIPPWLARVIRKRDKGCRYPGCRRTRWIHIHHIIHWAHGGPTDLDNLISLCPYHHRLIHEGGWHISGDPNGKVVWVMPGGYPYVPGREDKLAAKHGGLMLDDWTVPEHLKDPDDTS